MYNPFSLAGKTVLVTGASSGIGRSTAIECSRMGARIAVTGRDEERLTQTFCALEGSGHVMLAADLTDDTQVEALARALPALDGVVHCAGICYSMPAHLLDRQDLYDVFNTNLFSPIMLNKYLIEHGRVNHGVSFVLISSMACHAPSVGQVPYAGSKGAIKSVAQVMCVELAHLKARVNTIAPAMVETPMISFVPQETIEKDKNRYPLGYGQPEDVAYCVVYLLSDASRWVTCSEFILSGGLSY